MGCRSMEKRLVGRWRGSLPRKFVVAVFQDFSNDGGLGDEGEDFHLTTALSTGQWVHFVAGYRRSVSDIVDSFFPKDDVSTKAGQARSARSQMLPWEVGGLDVWTSLTLLGSSRSNTRGSERFWHFATRMFLSESARD